MNVTQKQAEFWVTLLALMIVVAIAVLFLDFGIKTAILDESTRLRLVIEEEIRGRNGQKATTGGAGIDADNDPPLPADVLVDHSTGMEATSGSNGDKAPDNSAGNRRTQPRRQAHTRAIPPRDK
jgi:hypothetical protein